MLSKNGATTINIIIQIVLHNMHCLEQRNKTLSNKRTQIYNKLF